MFPLPPSPTPSPGPRRTPGIASEDRGRIVLLGVGLLFCVALMAGLYAFVNSGPAAPPPDAVPGPARPGPTPDIKVIPLFPEEEADEIWRSIVEKFHFPVADGIAAVDPEAYEYLVDEATLDARVLNLLPEGFDHNPDPGRILADPGTYRGKLLSVAGELLSLERVPWEGKGAQVREVRRGLIRDGKGRMTSFSWPVANPLEPDAVEPGQHAWVRVQGLFYKLWPVPDPTRPGGTVPSFHLVLQRHPVRDFPPLEVKDIDPAWMEQVQDADPADMLSAYEDPFFYLLNFTGHLGPEGFEGWLKAKQAESPGLKIWPPEDFTGRYKALLDSPALYRLKPVRYTGFILRPTVLDEKEVPPNPGNMDRIWLAYLVDADFAPAIWVFAPRGFAEQGFKDEDHVRVDGIFYKRRAYQAQGKGPLHRAGVIIAGKITPAPLGKVYSRDLLWLVVILMIIIAGGVAYLLYRTLTDDRRAEGHQRERLMRRRKAALSAGGIAPQAAGSAAPPAPPPAPPADPPTGGTGSGA